MNVPMTYPVQVVIAATRMRMMIPGAMPRVLKAAGTESTPRPICDFKRRTIAATQPTYMIVSFGSKSYIIDLPITYAAVVRAIRANFAKDSICDLTFLRRLRGFWRRMEDRRLDKDFLLRTVVVQIPSGVTHFR